MGTIPLLSELALVAALGVLVTLVLGRLKLPTVAGLLAAGAIMGPSALGLVTSVHDIEVLAEVGVVLLLFTIGLEFSLSRLKVIFKQVALGGVLQVGVTFLLTLFLAKALGLSWSVGVFFGFAVALSSTAIVLRTLAERQELDAPHGRFIVGTLIFQDLCVVPMVLIVPLLAGSDGSIGGELAFALGKAVAVVVVTVVLARIAVPKFLNLVDANRSREVFLLAILSLCIGTAWLTSLAGLSLALGAFLGGMVVADTEYGHRAMSDILPLRDAFVSIFFVVLGMLFDLQVLIERPFVVLGLLLGFLIVKGTIATLAAMVMRFPARAAWLAGVGLAQFGEFGFVLTKLAEQNGVVTSHEVAPLLAAGILSMFLTPVMVRAAPHLKAGERLLAPLERLFGVNCVDELDLDGAGERDHVIIVGYGLAGTFAARALQAAEIPQVIIEMNIENVRAGRKQNLPVYYGDATSEEALQHAGIERARLAVILVNDKRAAERIAKTIRQVAPQLHILLRGRFFLERSSYLSAGANEVVAEELEGALEVVARMLNRLEAPRNHIESCVRQIRSDTQDSLRAQTLPRRRIDQLRGLDELKIETYIVPKGSELVGESLKSLDLRAKTGATLLGLRRNGQLIQSPEPSLPLNAEDLLFVAGTEASFRQVGEWFDPAFRV